MERYGFPTDNIYAPRGCPNCDGTGYLGRQALFEILVMDAGLRAVLDGSECLEYDDSGIRGQPSEYGKYRRAGVDPCRQRGYVIRRI